MSLASLPGFPVHSFIVYGAIESPLLCYCILQLEEQWKRRESWSIEHHEHQKKLRELQTQEFQQHVDERSAKVARQRRWSQGNRYHVMLSYSNLLHDCFKLFFLEV